MWIAQEHFPQKLQPFSINVFANRLSWSKIFWLRWRPCSPKNVLHQIIFVRKSSELTISDSVDERVPNFCFVLPEAMPPPRSLIIMSPPECNLKSGWTTKVASTLHLQIFSPSYLRIRCKSFVHPKLHHSCQPLLRAGQRLSTSSLLVFYWRTLVTCNLVLLQLIPLSQLLCASLHMQWIRQREDSSRHDVDQFVTSLKRIIHS